MRGMDAVSLVNHTDPPQATVTMGSVKRRIAVSPERRLELPEPPAWFRYAECHGAGSSEFFGNKGSTARTVIAKYCDRCSVKVECLAFGLEMGPGDGQQGIFGGVTGSARKEMLKGIRKREPSSKDLVLRVLQASGSWLTAQAIAGTLPYTADTVKRALYRLRDEGAAEFRRPDGSLENLWRAS